MPIFELEEIVLTAWTSETVAQVGAGLEFIEFIYGILSLIRFALGQDLSHLDPTPN